MHMYVCMYVYMVVGYSKIYMAVVFVRCEMLIIKNALRNLNK